MLDEYCPECGAHRIALFRYCLKCGLDYDELDARGELPGGPYTPAQNGKPVSRAARPVLVQTAPSAHVIGAGRRSRSARRLGQYVPVGIAAVLAVAIVGVLAIGAGSGRLVTSVQPSSPPAEAAAAAVTPPSANPTPIPTPTPTPVFAPTGETTQATVTSVIDGDTITVSVDGTEYRVRYIGVVAPALVNLDRPVAYMAQESADANRRLVSSANVILERDTSETDQYGQLLRDVWVDQDGTLVLVGLELVKAGLAKVDLAGPDQKYADRFTSAEGGAQTADIGMWSEPQLPLTGPTPTPLETALPRLVGVEPITVFSSSARSLRGGPGAYTWRTVRLADPSVFVRWDVRAPVTRTCGFDWRLESSTGAPISGSYEVKENGSATGTQSQPVSFDEAVLTVTTTCPTWTFSLQGDQPS